VSTVSDQGLQALKQQVMVLLQQELERQREQQQEVPQEGWAGEAAAGWPLH
jgi:hypothetical protein